MLEPEARLEEARALGLARALPHLAQRIRGRSDLAARQTIIDFDGQLEFEGQLEDLAIAEEAWQHIIDTQIDPKLPFFARFPTSCGDHPNN